LLNDAELQIKNDIDAISTLQKQLTDAKAETVAAIAAAAAAAAVPVAPAPVPVPMPVSTAADIAEKERLQQRVTLLEGQVRADLDTFATLKAELGAVEAAKVSKLHTYIHLKESCITFINDQIDLFYSLHLDLTLSVSIYLTSPLYPLITSHDPGIPICHRCYHHQGSTHPT